MMNTESTGLFVVKKLGAFVVGIALLLTGFEAMAGARSPEVSYPPFFGVEMHPIDHLVHDYDFAEPQPVQWLGEAFAERLVAGTNCVDAVVVADVEDVRPVAVLGLEKAYAVGTKPTPVYKVFFHVRSVEKGSFDQTRCFVFARRIASNPWYYYRGLTLKMGVRRDKDKWFDVFEIPTVPYPPYSDACQVLDAADCADLFDGVKTADALAIRFGNDVVACYVPGVLCEGPHLKVMDYGCATSVFVKPVSDGFHEDYWRHHWLRDVRDSNGGRKLKILGVGL